MRYQLSFQGMETFQSEILCQGIISPDSYIRRCLGNRYNELVRSDPASLVKEYERISWILGKGTIPDDETDEDIGCLTLLPSSVRAYYPDEFRPCEWVHKAINVQDDRRIYRFTTEKRDGSSQEIMVKGPKMSRWIGRGSGLISIVEMSPRKTSEEEMKLLVMLQDKRVPVEPPIGFFTHGNEHWLFTEFVEGRLPLDLLADDDTRQDLWRADARLLARLCNADVKHWGFYSKEFDDKLWVDGELVLIDTDESFHMSEGHNSRYLKAPQLSAYKDAWVIDCLSSYLFFDVLHEDEMRDYILTFLTAREDDSSRADELLSKVDPQRMSEESYLSMLMDSD